jgi:hypothetical protein
MRRTWLLFVVRSSLLAGRALGGQAHGDGETLMAKPRPVLAAFESRDDFGRSQEHLLPDRLGQQRSRARARRTRELRLSP